MHDDPSQHDEPRPTELLTEWAGRIHEVDAEGLRMPPNLPSILTLLVLPMGLAESPTYECFPEDDAPPEVPPSRVKVAVNFGWTFWDRDGDGATLILFRGMLGGTHER